MTDAIGVVDSVREADGPAPVLDVKGRVAQIKGVQECREILGVIAWQVAESCGFVREPESEVVCGGAAVGGTEVLDQSTKLERP